MFEVSTNPRVFALPPGVDFAQQLAAGLKTRMQDQAPEKMARVEVIVNTTRMERRLREALIEHSPGFLPRIRTIADLAPQAEKSTLSTRLELAQTIRSFLRAEPYLGPQTAAFSLAESLFRLLDEMQGEGVALEQLEQLDVSQHSEHWDRALRFIKLIGTYLGDARGGQSRLRFQILSRAASWSDLSPDHPVIVAGSTGSRGPASLLMQAVARLPQGAVVLPGFDFHQPSAVWRGLSNALETEDHPQFRFASLLTDLGLTNTDVRLWDQAKPADDARNALVSLALRPAPVTDQWMLHGRDLGDVRAATQNMSLIEASTPRGEAMAIAFCLRQAAVDGKKAALVTPDRTLARRVSTALDRWHLRPDDSAGRPLALSAPGRFLRQTAEILTGELTAQGLVALLKHPLAHSAVGRGPHLLHLRDLELYLRRKAIPFPDSTALTAWSGQKEERKLWAAWLSSIVDAHGQTQDLPLSEWIALHVQLAEHMAAGPDGADAGELWRESAGQAARAVMDELTEAAESGGELAPRDYLALIETLFVGKEVREVVESHPDIMIWGTLEARAQWADLVILGGMNDGTWPASPTPDPWFNRTMRHDAGLLLPERQIGLSAHDFQMAVAAPEVVISHAKRDAEAETIPSRWLNRLLNLINGLPTQNGPDALEQMRAKGNVWLKLAEQFESDFSHIPTQVSQRNPRPAPAPPVAARPRELPVTGIERLIRDPYEIYAKYVLNLREVDPLSPQPDPRLRGTILHKVLEEYVSQFPPGTEGNEEAFFAIAEKVLAQECPWNVTRRQWIARLKKSGAEFVDWNAGCQGAPLVVEKRGEMTLKDPLFTLNGKPDRIDIDDTGRLHIFDYKTGTPPSKKEQAYFNKQLILLALMAEDGAFPGVDPRDVVKAAYIGLGAKFSQVEADVNPDTLAEHRKGLFSLIRAYFEPNQGFPAMRAVKTESTVGAYHALARRGEWEPADLAQTIKVGDHDA